jgi:hypothetical protein
MECFSSHPRECHRSGFRETLSGALGRDNGNQYPAQVAYFCPWHQLCQPKNGREPCKPTTDIQVDFRFKG